jgi:hypothetical protein
MLVEAVPSYSRVTSTTGAMLGSLGVGAAEGEVAVGGAAGVGSAGATGGVAVSHVHGLKVVVDNARDTVAPSCRE